MAGFKNVFKHRYKAVGFESVIYGLGTRRSYSLGRLSFIIENLNPFANPFRRPIAMTFFLVGLVVAVWLSIGATLPIENAITLGLF